jgi:hypothetical protein
MPRPAVAAGLSSAAARPLAPQPSTPRHSWAGWPPWCTAILLYYLYRSRVADAGRPSSAVVRETAEPAGDGGSGSVSGGVLGRLLERDEELGLVLELIGPYGLSQIGLAVCKPWSKAVNKYVRQTLLVAGSYVEIHGLTSESSLNGVVGRIVAPNDEREGSALQEKGRLKVKVPLNTAGQPYEYLTDMDVEEQLGQFGCPEDHGFDVRQTGWRPKSIRTRNLRPTFMTDLNGARTLTGAAPPEIEKLVRDFITKGHRRSLDGVSKEAKDFPMAPAEIVSTPARPICMTIMTPTRSGAACAATYHLQRCFRIYHYHLRIDCCGGIIGRGGVCVHVYARRRKASRLRVTFLSTT